MPTLSSYPPHSQNGGGIQQHRLPYSCSLICCRMNCANLTSSFPPSSIILAPVVGPGRDFPVTARKERDPGGNPACLLPPPYPMNFPAGNKSESPPDTATRSMSSLLKADGKTSTRPQIEGYELMPVCCVHISGTDRNGEDVESRVHKERVQNPYSAGIPYKPTHDSVFSEATSDGRPDLGCTQDVGPVLKQPLRHRRE